MMIKSPKNKNCTRAFSDKQEKDVCNLLNAQQQSNSGAGKFNKGDVVQIEANMLIECKTATANKESFSIKKEWIEKNKNEGFSKRLPNHAIAFNFGPDSKENYFVINSRLMQFLVEKLIEENNN